MNCASLTRVIWNNIKDKQSKLLGVSLIGFIVILSGRCFFNPLAYYIGYKLSNYALRFRDSLRPKRIILIRHGQSEANINPHIYDHLPDNKISLSTLGFHQARQAGLTLKEIVNNETLTFIVSPLLRTKQTADEIAKNFDCEKINIIVDPRVREQEWGNYQNQEHMNKIFQIRKQVGKFYYRFSEGESGADVYDRVSSFLESLYREIDNYDRKKNENIVIVTHGLFMRLFIMRYFKMTIEKFDKLENPENCEIWVMEKNKNGKYELKSELREDESLSS